MGPPSACVLFYMERERVESGDGMIQINKWHAITKQTACLDFLF